MLGVSPALPKSFTVAWLEKPSVIAGDPWRRARLYPVLVALQSILSNLSPESTWAHRLKSLLDEYPDVPLQAMGIPDDWYEDPF